MAKQKLYIILYPLHFPSKLCDHCDKWNNSISRGSAWRKYNAVNVIYRINHDLLCDPESARKFHRKPRAWKPYKHNNEESICFSPLFFPLYFFQPYNIYIHIHFIICTYTHARARTFMWLCVFIYINVFRGKTISSKMEKTILCSFFFSLTNNTNSLWI